MMDEVMFSKSPKLLRDTDFGELRLAPSFK
jgi:hypothetical protein